jgi:Bax protein
MKANLTEIAVLPIAIVLTGSLIAYAFLREPAAPAIPEPVDTPDFRAITDVKTKKSVFFEFMLPMVRATNNRIRRERGELLRIAEKMSEQTPLTEAEISFVDELNIRYRLKRDPAASLEDMKALLLRVDVVPASLALAQAANESAWGTARFARNGNNYFGIWCWSRDCGLIPRERDAGAKHEVTAFESIERSIAYYMLTLNSHPAYASFRKKRSQLRQNDQPLLGHELAAGLTSYSERGMEYVNEIRDMIRINKLSRYRYDPSQASIKQ